jgi:hypothetical protein
MAYGKKDAGGKFYYELLLISMMPLREKYLKVALRRYLKNRLKHQLNFPETGTQNRYHSTL